VSFKKATLETAVAELNKQLGVTSLVCGGNGGEFTLEADHRPFWEIITEMNRQNPLLIANSMAISGAGTINTLRLMAGGPPHEYKVVDTFALLSPVVTGQPGTGSWMVRLVGFADPRVRISGYSQLRIEKITDQDGNSLMPLVVSNATTMISSMRPVMSWTSYATLNAAPGLTRIKELRAGMALSLVDKEQTVTLDLTKDVDPVDCARGHFTVDKNAAGNMTLHVTPSANAVNPPITPVGMSTVARSFPMTIRVLDKDGKQVQASYLSAATFTMALAAGSSRVEVIWTEKTRDMVVPVEYKDLEVPAGAAIPAVMRPLPMMD